MKEITFIKLNADKWKRLEHLIKNKEETSADEWAEHYMQVTDDLSYSKTFYKNSKTSTYLNQLSSAFHLHIYKNKKEQSQRLMNFFLIEIPISIYRGRKAILFSLLLFITGLMLGFVSSHYDEDYKVLMLGDEYVNMTQNNIENKNPLAVYDSQEESSMFLFIAQNNIRVSFNAFVIGIFFSLLTAIYIFYQAIHIGAFFEMFAHFGLSKTAFLGVFIHGTLELSAIVIAGGAGMYIGNALLFPGTHSRITALVMQAKDGLKIIIALVPIFIVAAFFESYVTRHYKNMNLYINLSIIIGSAAFIIFYFIIYPIKIYKKYGEHSISKTT